MTLAEFSRFAQSQVRRLGKTFRRPDDDWVPVAFLQGPDGGVSIHGLDWSLFRSGETKDAAAVLLRLLIAAEATRYAVLMNTHVARGGAEEAARVSREEVRVEHLPGARECLVLVVGDAESEQRWLAEIRRDGRRPPKLGPWQTEGEFFGEETRLSGRFFNLGAWMR